MSKIKILLFFTISFFGTAYFYLIHSQKPSLADFESRFNHANQLLLNDKNDEAIAAFEALIEIDDNYPAMFFNLGRAYAKKKEWLKAIIAFDESLKRNVLCEDLVYFHKGLCAYQNHDVELAITSFKNALEFNTQYVDALYYLGLIAQKQSQYEQAFEYFTQAVQLNPLFIEALYSLAHDARNNQNFSLAIDCCKKALEIKPNHERIYYAYLTMGDCSIMLGEHEKAAEYYQKACDANPQCHEAFNNLGTLYAGYYGDLKKGKEYLEKAYAIKPDHAGTAAGLSALYLVKGDLEKGWELYESRLKHFFQRRHRHFNQPRWDGIASLNNKTIVLHAEQGLGDTLQFIRYAHIIKNKGARVIVVVQKPLKPLLSLCPYIDLVITNEEQWPAHDYHAELMSLPYLLKTRIDSIPHTIPYLYADKKLEMEWQQKLASDKNFKIGICWHVEPLNDADVFRGDEKTISINSCKRSIPLELFMSLAQLQGITLYSLQKHNGVEELMAMNKEGLIKDFGTDFDLLHGSFMDTAAIMKQLDLVITADTSIAHLAGGFGVPVWVVLPFPADWRWLLNRSDSPWYPSMKLFRKKKGDKDWQKVMQEIKTALIQR